MTGFKYRGNVLCSICIDKEIQKDYAKHQQELERPPKLPKPHECEICGNDAITQIGLSRLCQKCVEVVEACDHANLETTETHEDNYLVTLHLCRECGLRFRPA